MRKSVLGYKIISKIKPKDAVTHSIKLEKGELINFIQVGENSNGYIKYIQIITSDGK